MAPNGAPVLGGASRGRLEPRRQRHGRQARDRVRRRGEDKQHAELSVPGGAAGDIVGRAGHVARRIGEGRVNRAVPLNGAHALLFGIPMATWAYTNAPMLVDKPPPTRR